MAEGGGPFSRWFLAEMSEDGVRPVANNEDSRVMIELSEPGPGVDQTPNEKVLLWPRARFCWG